MVNAEEKCKIWDCLCRFNASDSSPKLRISHSSSRNHSNTSALKKKTKKKTGKSSKHIFQHLHATPVILHNDALLYDCHFAYFSTQNRNWLLTLHICILWCNSAANYSVSNSDCVPEIYIFLDVLNFWQWVSLSIIFSHINLILVVLH